MTQENLKKSITLIGPSSVGKSLLAPELAKHTGYAVISVDDIITIADMEMSHSIGPSEKEREKFVLSILKEIEENNEFKHILSSSKLKEAQIGVLNEFLDLYDYYLSLFGSMQPFYETIKKHYIMQDNSGDELACLNNISITAAEILETVLKNIDKPLIIDCPATFGWNVDKINLPHTVIRALLNNLFIVDCDRMKKIAVKILSNTSTVLLCPGEDYEKRNAAKKFVENKVLLNDMQGYYEYADLIISANGLFSNPEDVHLKNRSWFNPEVIAHQRKLKNKGEISNVCDQILSHLQELNEANQSVLT